MCKNLIRWPKKDYTTVTGYKFVVKDSKGRYVSPITGIIYGVGKIPKPSTTEKRRMRAHDGSKYYNVFGSWVFPEPGSKNYNSQMEGLTGLFYTVYTAKRSGGYSYKVIKVTGRLVGTGEYNNTSIDLIDEIYSIEEVD